MFKILNKQVLASDIKRIDILAPNIAQKVKPGQFVSVCPEEDDERIPLSVDDSDPMKGTISLIFQEIGDTTRKLGALAIDQSVFSILGPLGVPATIKKVGVVVCIATGVGTAKLLPICRALRAVGNKVIGIIGARTKRDLMLESQMRLTCNKVLIATEDGSYERRALASDLFRDIIDDTKIDLVYAIGSADMMRDVCSITRERKIKTLVHLNPLMVDCMGMCGSCRVKVAGEMVLACTDGPEFDGHQVDFDNFISRKKAIEEWKGCRNRKSQSRQKKNGLKTLTKYLSDILRD